MQIGASHPLRRHARPGRLNRLRHRPALRAALAATLLVMLALLAACDSETRTVEDRFPVDGRVLLSVLVDDGAVTVEAGAAGAVVVSGEIDAERYSYEGTSGVGTVRLEVRRTRSLRSLLGGGGAVLRVQVPPGTRVDVTASNGAVTVTGPLGGGRLETSNGSVQASGIDGALAVRTSNGSVRVSDQRGDLTVAASNGNVVVLRHDGGAVVVETSNGVIEYGGAMAAGDSALITTNGSIVVELAGSPSFVLDARTTNGAVTSRYAVLDAVRTATALSGRIASGEATLRLRATNGSIELR